MPDRVFGAQPRPRALCLGFSEEEANAWHDLFPTRHCMDTFGGIHQNEWDVLVTCKGVPTNAAPHLFVMAIGGRRIGRPQDTTGLVHDGDIGRVEEVIAQELTVPDNLPGDILTLVENDLVPLERGPLHAALAPARAGYTQRPGGPMVPIFQVAGTTVEMTCLRVFLWASDKWPLAGSFVRQGGVATCYTLPDGVNVAAWLRVAISEWRIMQPARFPLADWTRASAWQTPAEEAAAASLAEVEKRRAELIADLTKDEEAATAALASASAEANASERLLLTAQSDALVDAVEHALSALGFDIRNMDKEWPPGDRREDLRVTHQRHQGWEAMVEVRSYGRGAKLGDLQARLPRFALRYERDEKHPPSACWFVVSQLVGRDPSERDPVLASNPHEVETFVRDWEGALIDTAELFRLWMRVQRVELSADDAAAQLVALRGRLEA